MSDHALTFASEIQGLLEDPSINRDVDLEAVDLYFTLGYIPAPWSIYRSVRKLQPGHCLIWEGGRISFKQYWNISFDTDERLDEDEITSRIRSLLEDSVRLRMISDVPFGAFLSGGIDSSIVVSLMARNSGQQIKTYSIGFDDDLKGELPYAREIAKNYNTNHTELVIRPNMTEVLPRLLQHYGEPFGDSSAVATHYVSELAGQSVKVVLSGDGGDEVFGGYIWYVNALRNSDLALAYSRDGFKSFRNGWRNQSLRTMLGALKGTASGYGTVLAHLTSPIKAYERLMIVNSHAQRKLFYRTDVRLKLSNPWPGDRLIAENLGDGNWPILNQMFHADHHLFLPDDILTKVDIASMTNSLEVRSPFLDYRLVEFAASLPPSLKVSGLRTKRVLRSAFEDILPSSITERPKRGFGLPIGHWLRQDLYYISRELLLNPQAYLYEYFNQEVVTNIWNNHMQRQGDFGYQLWLFLCFEIWAQSN